MTSCPDVVLAAWRGACGVRVDESDRIAGQLDAALGFADDLGAEAVLALALRGSGPFR